jgi:hypothetical protein
LNSDYKLTSPMLLHQIISHRPPLRIHIARPFKMCTMLR